MSIDRLLQHLKALDWQVGQIERETEQCIAAAKSAGVWRALPEIGPMYRQRACGQCRRPRNFKNARQFAAWIGRVPHQNSSGGKTQLLGSSKRGNVYLRTLLIHGGRTMASLLEERPIKPTVGSPDGSGADITTYGRSDGQQERAPGVGFVVIRQGSWLGEPVVDNEH